ncbi:hypothetical protein [Nitrosomonas sp.]|uniref:hypothetical protein n=1 Tax=Nitrosomonas sp. TaxID=42353 RepID=UPI0025E94A75|nr:hypothetical protein [Nitrosomonas sp.]MCC6916996.1 hypothetical protein [Nitrosomonas sp.]
MSEIKPVENESQAKKFVVWATLIGSVMFWGLFLAYIALNLFCDQNSWIIQLMKEHAPAMLLLPLAALASFCNVLLLKITDGKIEIEVLKLRFQGASGPIIMWVISFGTMATAIYFLWSLKV